MPGWDVLAVFVLASLALNLTPGPDMLYTAAQSLGGGVRAGIAAAIGVAVGALGHTVLAAAGVSALLAAEPTLFDVLRLAGAGYLIWLGIQAFRAVPPQLAQACALPVGRVFLRGMVTNLLNPKVALFVLAFLPQFADPLAGAVWLQIMMLGVIFCIGGGVVLCAIALFSGGLGLLLARRPGFAKWPNRISGLVMVALAARLLTDGGAPARP